MNDENNKNTNENSIDESFIPQTNLDSSKKENFYTQNELPFFYEAVLKFDKLFHSIIIKKDKQLITLSDRHKWIALLGFEMGLCKEKKIRLLFPKDVFSKAIYFIFFCIGNIIDAINKQVNEDRIIVDLRSKQYLYKGKSKQVLKLESIENDNIKLICEKDELTSYIPIQTFIKEFKEGIYRFTDEKSYQSKKNRDSHEQKDFFKKVIAEVQKTFLSQPEIDINSFDAIELDEISYFHPNQSVLKEINSLSIHDLNCSKIFLYNFWIPQGTEKPKIEHSVKNNNHGRIFIHYFNYSPLFFEQVKKHSHIKKKIICDIEEVSIYKEERSRIEEKLKNLFESNKESVVTVQDSIHLFKDSKSQLDPNLPIILFSLEHFKLSDKLCPYTTKGIIKNFAKTDIKIIEMPEDPFSKTYSIIWKNKNNLTEQGKQELQNQFIYPYYQSLFLLDGRESQKKFEEVVNKLIENPLLKNETDIIELLNYSKNPKLDILIEKLKSPNLLNRKIAIVGTQDTISFLPNYIQNLLGDFPINYVTKGQILKENRYDIIFITGYLSKALLDLYYGSFADEIYTFVYQYEKKIIETNLYGTSKEQVYKMTSQNMKYIFQNSNVYQMKKEVIEKTFEEEIQEKENSIILEKLKNNEIKIEDKDILTSAIPIYFSDEKYRLFLEDGSSRLLFYNNKGEPFYKQKRNTQIQMGDTLLIMDHSEGYSYEHSITETLLENPKILKMYKETQVWREELKQFYDNHNLNIHSLKSLFEEKQLIKEEITIRNWLYKKYQFSTSDYKKEIPIILKTIGSLLNDGEIKKLLNNIREFLSLKFSIGRFFKRILLEVELKGNHTYEIFDKMCNEFLSQKSVFQYEENNKLIQNLFQISNNIKNLEVIQILSKINISYNSELLKRPISLEDIK